METEPGQMRMGIITQKKRVWLKEFFRHPLCYVEATWNQNYYVFAPYVDNVVYNKNHQLSLSAEHFLKIVQEVYPYEKRKK